MHQILKDTTLYFLRGTLNLATIIPAMDHIDAVFTSACLPSSKYKPAIHAAIETAKKTLNQYYSLTDALELYWIAMGMQHQTYFYVIMFG